jgi:hypothetical protein
MGVERFHWHETSTDVWYYYSHVQEKVTAAREGASHRFVTENGNRFLPRILLEFRPNRMLSLTANAKGITGTVGYVGGLQYDVEQLIEEGYKVDSAEFDGVTWVRGPVKALKSYTGYRGFQLGLEARVSDAMAVVAGRRVGLEGTAGCSFRSTRRLISYTNTRSAGYDEVWAISWADLGLGAFVAFDRARLGARWGLLVPLSTKETIQEVYGGADINRDGRYGFETDIVPETRNGWRSSLYWERPEGLRLEFTWETRSYGESPVNGGIMQPASLESMGRLETTWLF